MGFFEQMCVWMVVVTITAVAFNMIFHGVSLLIDTIKSRRDEKKQEKEEIRQLQEEVRRLKDGRRDN